MYIFVIKFKSFLLQVEDIKEIALKTAALPKENSKRPRMVIFTQGSEATVCAYGKYISYSFFVLLRLKVYCVKFFASLLLGDIFSIK